MGNKSRQRSAQIMVRVSPGEKDAIRAEASKYSLSMPAYLRTLGLGFAPKSTLDQQAIARLAKLHGDLGRVSGLLKLLPNDSVAAGREHQPSLRELLDGLGELKREIEVMRLPSAKKDAHGNILEPGCLLVFVAGQAPIYGRQILYFHQENHQ